MPYKAIAGVYIIQSLTKPERVYVGSSINIKSRWDNHKQDLKKNKHHSLILQNHVNKYGCDDLIYEIIESGEYFNKNHLLSREQGWIYHFQYENTEKPYFNIVKKAGSVAGVKRSPEYCKRSSIRQTGKKRTTPIWNKGLAGTYKVSNISKALRGNQYAKGKHWTLSKEARRKRSESLMGEKHPMFGKHQSPEYIAKRMEAIRLSKVKKVIINIMFYLLDNHE